MEFKGILGSFRQYTRAQGASGMLPIRVREFNFYSLCNAFQVFETQLLILVFLSGILASPAAREMSIYTR